jgi:hypothetical protein
MRFQEIIKEIEKVSFEMLRAEVDDYFEAVILNSELGNFTPKIEKFFGKPRNLSKDALSSDEKKAIMESGGIRPGQEIYFSHGPEGMVFVMLWPWLDKKHTTVKLVKR